MYENLLHTKYSGFTVLSCSIQYLSERFHHLPVYSPNSQLPFDSVYLLFGLLFWPLCLCLRLPLICLCFFSFFFLFRQIHEIREHTL